MLDLGPIKARVEAATSWSIQGDGGEFQQKAVGDVLALVAEVERLRRAIRAHKAWLEDQKITVDYADRNLWTTLDG